MAYNEISCFYGSGVGVVDRVMVQNRRARKNCKVHLVHGDVRQSYCTELCLYGYINLDRATRLCFIFNAHVGYIKL